MQLEEKMILSFISVSTTIQYAVLYIAIRDPLVLVWIWVDRYLDDLVNIILV